MYHIGLDIGSTTIKCVVLDEQQNLLYHTYERHYSHIVEKAAEVLAQADEAFVKGASARLALSGSAGMGFAESCDIPFVQEVYATRIAANRYMPGTDVVTRYLRVRENSVSHKRHRGAHERLVRRRHGRVYRPDGHPSAHDARRDERGGQNGAKNLYHRQPLRRVCQK